MEGLGDFIKKISDGAKSFATLLDNDTFKKDLDKAGTIGGLIKIGIDLYEQVKDKLQTDEERAFYPFYKVAFESARESIPAEDRDKIPITDVKGNKNTKEELFKTFTNIEEWNSYLPDHPTIIKFRTLICDILKDAQHNKLVQNSNLIRDFIFKFNITLEEKADNDPAIQPFKRWSRLAERTKNLLRHLEYSRLLIYKTNPVDQKPLEEYYVENNALFLSDINTWEKEDNYFSTEKKYEGKETKARNLINSFLKEKKWYMVIGATFGIGKTSLAIHLTSTIALKYLEDPNDEYNYIPIFVPLKGKLTNIDEDQNSLDDKIKSIADGVEGKKKKILVICDGLDEYGEDESKLLKEFLEKRNKDLPNIKVIITTRLEAGIPQKLDISSYIRLVPFSEDQVNQFFQKYGLLDIRFDILKSYNLTEEEIFKPLFCWMFAIMRNSKSFDTKTIFKGLDNPSMTRALIYQGFIHSIIRGKYKDIAADEYHWTQYHLTEEKHILRKIAALRQMHYPTILTKSMVIEGLKNYGISYDEATLKDVLDPILTSYFYFQSTTARDMSMDFIHKSFREYFLAEYYLESILDGKGHYLNVGVPTPETILFLDGL